jgi:hypothetical protein
MDISKEIGKSIGFHQSGAPIEVAEDETGMRYSRLQEFMEDSADVGPAGYRDIYAMSEAAGAPVSEREVMGTMGGFVPGKVAGVIGAPGDIAALATGLYKAAFPDADQGRLDAFIQQVEEVSNKFGSGATLGFLNDMATKAGIPEDVKQGFMQGAEVGSFFGLGQGAVATGKGVAAAGKAVAEGAPARIAERGEGVTLGMGVDPMEVIDPALAAAGKLARPTKENPVTAVPPTETEPGIIAFHGSGADFDQFSLEKIGTGEGAQAYGYGLYFTDSEDIAKFYKDMMARNVDIDGRPYIRGNQINDNLVDEDIADDLGATNGDLEAAIKSSEEFLQEMIEADNVQAINSTSKELEKLKQLRGRVTVGSETGKTYKVALEPKSEELLDYDKPIGEQPEEIKVALIKALEDINEPELNANILLEARVAKEKQEAVVSLNKELDDFSDSLPNQQSKETFAKLRELLIDKRHKWSAMVNRDDVEEERRLFEEFTKAVPPSKYPDIDPNIIYDIQRSLKIATPKSVGSFLPTDKKTADALSNAGIKGIKYRAAVSRSADVDDAAAERNYVIFDDKMIKILEKYGIVGPVAVTALGATKQESADNG